MTQARRRRGRPTGADVADRRDALLQAAREQFAAKGFAGASLRSIAAQAGVDASLVGHYFGDKQGLFIATLDLPINPLEKLRAVVEPGPDGLAERLVRTFVTSWDPHATAFAALVRSGLTGDPASPAPAADIVRAVLRDVLTVQLEGDDRELRASLVLSQMLGLGIARYVICVESLVSADVEDVVRRYAPGLQQLVDGDGP
ncbi:TetR family transcriptional regulator [Aeromicrobium sp. CTD01-1L150]|uniref:TetR/AcrR family transcriptional regulator n=1 Tax=Aeromicrobium sp. CTD01-1L150 TaxID=3341830 RepID=UPI0035C21850